MPKNFTSPLSRRALVVCSLRGRDDGRRAATARSSTDAVYLFILCTSSYSLIYVSLIRKEKGVDKSSGKYAVLCLRKYFLQQFRERAIREGRKAFSHVSKPTLRNYMSYDLKTPILWVLTSRIYLTPKITHVQILFRRRWVLVNVYQKPLGLQEEHILNESCPPISLRNANLHAVPCLSKYLLLTSGCTLVPVAILK